MFHMVSKVSFYKFNEYFSCILYDACENVEKRFSSGSRKNLYFQHPKSVETETKVSNFEHDWNVCVVTDLFILFVQRGRRKKSQIGKNKQKSFNFKSILNEKAQSSQGIFSTHFIGEIYYFFQTQSFKEPFSFLFQLR